MYGEYTSTNEVMFQYKHNVQRQVNKNPNIRIFWFTCKLTAPLILRERDGSLRTFSVGRLSESGNSGPESGVTPRTPDSQTL